VGAIVGVAYLHNKLVRKGCEVLSLKKLKAYYIKFDILKTKNWLQPIISYWVFIVGDKWGHILKFKKFFLLGQ